jgi:hypothetical protein
MGVMFELNRKIARLEMCSEQLRLHLRSIDRASDEAAEVRSDLLTMLQQLSALKGERLRLADTLQLDTF